MRQVKNGLCRPLSSEKGLTLIEVLVSFVILVSLITVASELFRLSVDGIFRVKSEARIAQSLPNIRAIISDLDLEEKGSGQARWGGILYEWKSKVLNQARSKTNFPDPESPGPPGPGRFLMKLYEIQVSVQVLERNRHFSRQFTLLETQFKPVGD